MSDTGPGSSAPDRRNFLKIGAGVVVGAVVAGVGVAAYESSVIGSNNSSSSSVVSSLNDELTATQSQLNSAQNTISTLSSQLASSQTALGSAQSSLSAANSQNTALSSQLTATQQSLSSASGQVASLQGTVSSQSNAISSLQGQVSTASAQVTSLNSQVTSLQSQATSLNSTVSSLQNLNAGRQGYVYLNTNQAALLEAVASTIIPTDSNGPGAATAGVTFFIDGQLGSAYGSSGNMYMKGPFVQGNITTPITVNGVTYSAGSLPITGPTSTGWQYAWTLVQFWDFGLDALQAYAVSAYGGTFQSLSAANQTKCLQDLWNNVPTTESFYGIIPSDFAHELFMMVWNGFLTDPVYGGNQGMVGWILEGFNALNSGDFYGEGYTITDLINATTLIPLQPASIGLVQASESS